jgi:hypothetical protein
MNGLRAPGTFEGQISTKKVYTSWQANKPKRRGPTDRHLGQTFELLDCFREGGRHNSLRRA